MDVCAPLVQQLLSVAPEPGIRATSRETLCVTGERVLAVAPLPQADAAELLRQRTAAVRPGFEVTEANQAEAARLCADLGRLHRRTAMQYDRGPHLGEPHRDPPPDAPTRARDQRGLSCQQSAHGRHSAAIRAASEG